MGAYIKSEYMQKDVLMLLRGAEPLGFSRILAKLQKNRKEQGKKLVSSETLSEGLKNYKKRVT